MSNFRDWWFKKFGVKLEDDINQTITSDEAKELWNCAYEAGYRKAMTISTKIDNAV